MTQEQIREMNQVNIINFIKVQGETTKQIIAKELSLSVPTVTQIVNNLIADKLVIEAGVAHSTGGRKPMVLRFVEDAKYTIGVSITPNKIEAILGNLNMKEVDRKIISDFSMTTLDEIILELLTLIEKMIIDNGLTKEQILGVGISAPGTVDEDKLILLNAPNIKVRDYDLKPFEEKLGIKLFIENEANVAALAEVKLGGLKDARHIVYVSVTEGVGTGIVIDHQIFKGINKMSGEFGHMRISNEKVRCNCGRTGCWEIYASKGALLKEVKAKTGISVKSVEDIFNNNFTKSTDLNNALQCYMDNLLIGIENIILGFNPEYVVIGGELGDYEEFLNPYIIKSEEARSSILSDQKTKIIFSKLKSQGSLLGAALLPLQTLFSHKDSVI